MGNIDNLDFKLILDDKDFNEKIAAAKRSAQKLNTDLSTLLNLKKSVAKATRDEASISERAAQSKVKEAKSEERLASAKERVARAAELRRRSEGVSSHTSVMNQEKEAQAVLKTAQEQERLNNLKRTGAKISQDTNKVLVSQGTVMQQLAGYMGRIFSVYGVTSFLSNLVKITGEFEVQQQSLRVILNDARKADDIFERLRQFAVESPYTFQELASYTKQLAAFSIPTEKLLETNKMLADVAAGLGVSMDRIILAYGHVKSSGFLRGMQLRQFTQNGVPILEELSAILTEVTGKTVTLGEVFDKMEKREIPFEYIEEAFKRMTSEGGKFYRMQEVLVETLKGRIGKLRDVWQQSVYDLGQANSGPLKGAVDVATTLAKHLDIIINLLGPLVAGVGAYAAVSAIAWGVEKVNLIAQFCKYILNLAKGLKAAAAAQAAFGASSALATGALATTAGAIAAILAVLTALGVGIYEVVKAFKTHNEVLDKVNKAASKTEAEMRAELLSASKLLKEMKELKVGTDEYNKVKEQLLNDSGQYLSDLDKEKIAVGDLSGVYEHLAEKMSEAARTKFLNDATSQARTTYANTMTEIVGTLRKKFKNISAEDEGQLISYLYGDISKEDLSESAKSYFNAIDASTGRLSGTLVILKNRAEAMTQALEDAGKRAAELSKSLGLGGPDKKDPGITRLSSLVQGMKNTQKEIDKLTQKFRTFGLTGEEQETLKQLQNDLDEQKKRYKELMGLNYDKELRAEETEEEKRIKSRITILTKLKDAYEKLSDVKLGLSQEEIQEKMTNLFPENMTEDIKVGDYKGRILSLIDALRAINPEDADKLAASLGMDGLTLALKELNDALAKSSKAEKAMITYRDLIQSLTSEDVNVEGKGFWYDLSKISSDLNTKLNKLAVSGQKAKEKLAGLNTGDESAKGSLIKSLLDEGFSQEEADAWWEKWINGGSVAIDAFLAEMADKARAQAGENVTNLAKNYLEETFFANGIDFDNLADRSLMQLETLRSKLLSVTADLKIGSIDQGFLDANMVDTGNLKGIDLNDTENNAWLETLDEGTVKTLKLMQAVQMAGGSFDDFEGAINKVVKGKLKDLTDEEKKGLASLGKMATDSLGKVASAAKELGEASGNEGLVNASELFEQVNEIGGSIAQGFSQGGIIGAAVAGVTSLATGFLGAAADAARFKNALNELNRQMTLTALRSMINSEEFETVFGTDEYGQVIESVKAANEAFSMYSNTLEKFQRNGRKGVEGIKQMKAVTRKGFLGIGRKKKSLGSLVPGLFNDDGTIDRQALETFIDSEVYDRLGDKDKKLLRELLDDMSIYENAIAAMHDYLSSIFGDLGAQISDALTDAFVNGTDAAKAFTDSVGDMLERLGQQIIYSATLGPLLDEAQEAFEKITRDENLNKDQKFEQYAKTLTVLVNGAADAQEDAMRLYKKYKDMAFAAGFDIFNADEEENPDTVGKGISSVTEDTANLLASYLNAVRGDVSVMRLEQTGFFGFMRSQMPTLNDHLARIEAYSYDISQSNARILAEMQSVIGNVGSGGTHSVKVELIQ